MLGPSRGKAERVEDEGTRQAGTEREAHNPGIPASGESRGTKIDLGPDNVLTT